MEARLKLQDAKILSYYGPSGRSGCNSLWQYSGSLEKHQHPGSSEVGVISCEEKIEIKERRHLGQSSVYTWEPRCRHGTDDIYFCCQSVGDKNVRRVKGEYCGTVTKKTVTASDV